MTVLMIVRKESAHRRSLLGIVWITSRHQRSARIVSELRCLNPRSQRAIENSKVGPVKAQVSVEQFAGLPDGFKRIDLNCFGSAACKQGEEANMSANVKNTIAGMDSYPMLQIDLFFKNLLVEEIGFSFIRLRDHHAVWQVVIGLTPLQRILLST